MPGPQNYQTRSVTSAVANSIPEPEEESSIMATGYKLEKFRGDGTDDIEDFLKRFDRYVNVANVKQEQKSDLLCLHLEGRASWFVDNLNPPPADLAALRKALTDKFVLEKHIKIETLKMKKLDLESVNDFIYRVEKETHKLKFPEELKVQIALDGLEPSVKSAISSHGPKTLEDVRILANRVQASAPVCSTTPMQKDDSLQQILSLLQTLVQQKPVQYRSADRQPPEMSNQRFHQATPRPIRGRSDNNCYRCGGRSCSKSTCPAMGKTCHFCNKLNHFQSVCRENLKQAEENKIRKQ